MIEDQGEYADGLAWIPLGSWSSLEGFVFGFRGSLAFKGSVLGRNTGEEGQEARMVAGPQDLALGVVEAEKNGGSYSGLTVRSP